MEVSLPPTFGDIFLDFGRELKGCCIQKDGHPRKLIVLILELYKDGTCPSGYGLRFYRSRLKTVGKMD